MRVRRKARSNFQRELHKNEIKNDRTMNTTTQDIQVYISELCERDREREVK